MSTSLVRVGARVARALAAGEPVVALESALVAHGLPRPANLAVALALEARVGEAGAVPATVAVVAGVPTVGLDEAELRQIASSATVTKLGVRDLAAAVVNGRDGATTVASTAHLAALAGVKLFATGGIGGVHRGARDSWDVSADLAALASTPVTVVCAGVKSVLDVAATLERLESLSVPVVGYRTQTFPGFYLTDSSHPLEWRADDAAEVAAIVAAHERLGGPGGLLVVQSLPPEEQLDPELHDRVLTQALAAAGQAGVSGKALTPFLLDRIHRGTDGASLAANVRLAERNAQLAGEIAVALSSR